jgi:hypothetical protein
MNFKKSQRHIKTDDTRRPDSLLEKRSLRHLIQSAGKRPDSLLETLLDRTKLETTNPKNTSLYLCVCVPRSDVRCRGVMYDAVK